MWPWSLGIIYMHWLLLLTLGLLPCGIGFFGHAIEQRLQHGQQAGRERLSQPVTYVAVMISASRGWMVVSVVMVFVLFK